MRSRSVEFDQDSTTASSKRECMIFYIPPKPPKFLGRVIISQNPRLSRADSEDFSMVAATF